MPPSPDVSELIRALDTDEALAARILYRQYAAGVRFHLRRIHPAVPVDNLVLSVLIEASRRLRSIRPFTRDQATATVLECTRQEARLLPTRPEWALTLQAGLNLRKRSELVNALFTGLEPLDRQILLRLFVLRQNDSEVACEMNIPENRVSKTRASARYRFKRLSENVYVN